MQPFTRPQFAIDTSLVDLLATIILYEYKDPHYRRFTRSDTWVFFIGFVRFISHFFLLLHTDNISCSTYTMLSH